MKPLTEKLSSKQRDWIRNKCWEHRLTITCLGQSEVYVPYLAVCQATAHTEPEDDLDPCINCGQTEGEVFQGQPHDHVCPDCGREMPYKEA